MRRAIGKSVTAVCMIACAQLALGADDGQLKLGLRFDRSLSQAADPYSLISRTAERLPFIQRESAFDYIVDANHWVVERALALNERQALGGSFSARARSTTSWMRITGSSNAELPQ